MTSFSATLTQMAVLFLLIAIGYILAKSGLVPEDSEKTLSKLENNIFLPALVLSTFIGNFTVSKLSSMGKLVLISIALQAIILPLAVFFSRTLAKDRYTRNIYLYSLCFANFGFMGNAVVKALFPQIFTEYTVFTLFMWTMIYLWAIPFLLMGDGTEKISFKGAVKNLLNPMFFCVIIGMIVGITGIPVPTFVTNLVDTLSDCMSPIAMLLTGMCIARFNLKEILSVKSVYIVTAIRLFLFPALFIVLAKFIPMSETARICAFCAISMPLGLNTVVIPAGYGRDTRIASGMALVSHLLSCLTIPIMFALMDFIMKL